MRSDTLFLVFRGVHQYTPEITSHPHSGKERRMILDRETFAERLRSEPDTEYIKALLMLAKSWSQQWVIEDLEKELKIRKHEWAVGLQHA